MLNAAYLGVRQEAAMVKKLFQHLLWPAAAGNVAWSFFTVAIEWSGDFVTARLLALLLIAIYLGLSWAFFDNKENHGLGYWVMEGVHLITVIVFSIATQLDKEWLTLSLFILFAVTALGHISGAWNKEHKVKLSLASVIGIIVLLGSTYVGIPKPYHLALSIFVVLVAWGIVRLKLIPCLDNRNA